MINADSVIQFLNKGGAITTDELKHYLQKMEKETKTAGADGYRRFLINRFRNGKTRKDQRLEQELGQILLDTAEYLYKMRRLRNGQELTEISDENTNKVSERKVRKGGAGKEDKRFRGSERIQI